MSQIFLFMGIQGSGKGTQAARLSERLGIPHVSTGDIFRATIKQQTPLGEELRAILPVGVLLPHQLHEGFVDQFGGLQGVTIRLAPHGALGDAVEFFIDDGCEAIGGAGDASLHLGQDDGDVQGAG